MEGRVVFLVVRPQPNPTDRLEPGPTRLLPVLQSLSGCPGSFGTFIARRQVNRCNLLYFAKTGSWVTMVKPSVRAWAIRIRSKGSR